MTEQEIINVLKENKTKGVAYLFLPQDVWDWIGNNLNNPKLIYLSPDGIWRFFFETDFDDYDNVVFALPEYYQIKKESNGEWAEFEINDNGQFRVVYEDEQYASYYDWFYWQLVLEKSKDLQERNQITAFGGWQYKDSKRWYLAPAVKLKDGNMWNSYVIEESGEATPVIPIKIRFWRENR